MAVLAHPPDRTDGGRGGKLVPVGLFLILLAFAVVEMRHALPSSLRSLLIEPKWLDRDVGIHETTTADPAASTIKAPKAIITVPKQEEESTFDENVTHHLNHLRRQFDKACSHNDSLALDPKALGTLLQGHLATFFTSPLQVEKLEEGKDPVKPCRYTFLDLGANIGDSLGKFIDAGFSSDCPALVRIKKRPHYNIAKQGDVVMLGNQAPNDLTTYAKRYLTELSRRPEEYCYVGVEGNPVFTERLHEFEARIKGITPPPIRSAHFYTESVAAGVDGPTVLYLDTINTKQNFWGSSILATHTDAKKSAAKNNNVTVEAPVMGLTLSTLLKRSVRKEAGAHVLIKVDIEGGEYPVMNEAINMLCNYTSAGVRVDLILELHGAQVVGGQTPDMKLFLSETKQRLKDCNIQQGHLAARDGQRK